MDLSWLEYQNLVNDFTGVSRIQWNEKKKIFMDGCFENKIGWVMLFSRS